MLLEHNARVLGVFLIFFTIGSGYCGNESIDVCHWFFPSFC